MTVNIVLYYNIKRLIRGYITYRQRPTTKYSYYLLCFLYIIIIIMLFFIYIYPILLLCSVYLSHPVSIVKYSHKQTRLGQTHARRVLRTHVREISCAARNDLLQFDSYRIYGVTCPPLPSLGYNIAASTHRF